MLPIIVKPGHILHCIKTVLEQTGLIYICESQFTMQIDFNIIKQRI